MSLYIYDDSFEGLLTAVFNIFYNHDNEATVISQKHYTGCYLFEQITVKTDPQKSDRVWNGVRQKLSVDVLQDIYYIFLSELPEAGGLVLGYLREGFKIGPRIRGCLHMDAVKNALRVRDRVAYEAHRFKGFVRFRVIKDELYIADISPDYNILPLISPHFSKRYPGLCWIIRDLKHGIASVCQNARWYITALTEEGLRELEVSDAFEELWRGYFKTIAIKERINPRLQKQYMPRRYWRYLIETHEKNF